MATLAGIRCKALIRSSADAVCNLCSQAVEYVGMENLLDAVADSLGVEGGLGGPGGWRDEGVGGWVGGLGGWRVGWEGRGWEG